MDIHDHVLHNRPCVVCRLVVVFYVSSVARDATGSETIWSGRHVVKQLRSKIHSHNVFDFSVISLDTVGTY